MIDSVARATMAGLLCLAAAVPAAAQDSNNSQTKKDAADQNEVVCEKITVPGSRIATKRVCQTRAQWAEQRAQNRLEIEARQTQRGTCEAC